MYTNLVHGGVGYGAADGSTGEIEIFLQHLFPGADSGRRDRFVRKGDALVVTKLDRLARSVPDLVKILSALDQKNASLRILAMNLDTETPTGRLLINLVGSIAQFEREIMLERQREGIAKAKAEGKYKGRAAAARARASEVLSLKNQGKRVNEIATATGMGRASVYRILAQSRRALKDGE